MNSPTSTIYRRSSRPWFNAYPEAKATAIAEEFRFPAEFDLADKLSEMAWRYLGRRRHTGRPRQIIDTELAAAVERGFPTSMLSAILIQLWKTANPRLAKTATERSSAAATCRAHRNMRGSPGAIPDLARLSFFRTLGAIYEDGTGKPPWITGFSTRRPRGTPYRFIVAVCEPLKMAIPQHFLGEVLYRHRRNQIQPADLNK
jgi:hypothetical protein